jgi:hypothetical protein
VLLVASAGLHHQVRHRRPRDTRSIRPDLILVRSNVRGAYRHCNSVRGNKMRVGQPARNEQVAGYFNPRTSRSSGDVGKLTTPF